MIVKMKYEDVKGNTLKVFMDDKKVPAYMRVSVTSDNISEALTKYGNARNVVAFDYTGDIQTLNNLDLYCSVPVCVKFELEDVDSTIDDIMESITNSKVRVIIKLPESFCNMQAIEQYSEKYSNVHFCGGHFLRLEGCRIGCIGVEDIPKKVHPKKIKLECKGCACVYETVDINEFDNVEFTDEIIPVKNISVKSDKPKATKSKSSNSKSKKVVSSILSLAREKGVVEF